MSLTLEFVKKSVKMYEVKDDYIDFVCVKLCLCTRMRGELLKIEWQ